MQMYRNLSGTRSIGSSSAPVRSAGVSVPRGRRSAVMVEARKVAVLGAGGGIGQPLSLLLKMNKCITDLSLYDIGGVQGVAADISHCNTPVKVGAYNGQEELASAIKNADVIIIPAGVPRKPGMTRDDLFNVNAGIVKSLVETITTECPGAIIQLVTNPVNSTVPIAAEVMKKKGVHDARKIMGVTTLDVVRANTFVSEARNLDVKDVDVPVVGGHAGATILPLLSQVTPPVSFSDEEKKAMTEKIQNAGTVVVEAKAGKGSATLSMAYAAARMAESTLLGLNGEPSIYECSYVESSVVPDCPFFASKVLLGPEGVSKVFELGSMDAVEQAGMEAMLPELKASIQKGIAFANAQ